MGEKAPGAYSGKQATEKIINRLAEAEQPLPVYLEFFHKILLAQSELKQPDPSEIITALKQKTEQRLGAGTPAITFTDLHIDWPETLDLFCKVVELTNDYVKQESDEKEELLVCCENSDVLAHTAKLWFEIGTLPRDATSQYRETASSLTSSVLQATLYPVLSVYSGVLSSLVKQDQWQKNYCPVCGGSPDFSFLDKEHGARWLLCSRCDAQWLFKRLVCPYCGNDDHKSLAYFTDDHSSYRLYTCDKCHTYIKAIDLRQTKEDTMLPLERVLTLDMDRQAREMGYAAEI